MTHELRSTRLRLRPEEPRDNEELIRLAPLRAGESVEEQAIRMAGHAEVSNRWFVEYGFGVWIIELPGQVGTLGFVGAKPNDEPSKPELMYGLGESARGKGHVAEAAQAVMQYLFTLPATTEVWAQTDPQNRASWRVMERLGMRFEYRGMFKDEDSVVYRLMRTEFEAGNSALAEPTPWSLREILADLELSAARTVEFFATISADQFTRGDATHWSPAHHLGHLTMTYAGLARAVRAGRRLPGHPTALSRGQQEIGAAARAALDSAPAHVIANNPFSPTLAPHPDVDAMGRELLDANAGLRALLAQWSEAELDGRAVPHPLMGPLSVREMLLFIVLHDRHHVSGVRRRLHKGN